MRPGIRRSMLFIFGRLSVRVYITFCSAKKDDALRDSNRPVPPELLYVSRRIQGFMRRCTEEKVCWAILSDD